VPPRGDSGSRYSSGVKIDGKQIQGRNGQIRLPALAKACSIQINYPIAIIIVAILVAYVGLVYGPIGAFLAEYFPSRIRYTSVSVPYHIGNGGGGGLPFITTAAYQATGSLGYALIYPIAVPAVCFVLSLFLMPETRKMKIWEPQAVKA
jgi:nitrate/nitrite transporter NarK